MNESQRVSSMASEESEGQVESIPPSIGIGGEPSTGPELEEIPAMAVVLRPPHHRQKLNSPSGYDGTALVARSVSTKEIATNPKAKIADDAEWKDLRRMQT